jgi:predicted transposase/invertase (TIGR01784 family)
LSQAQVTLFGKHKPQELYPEYYLIKAGDFDEDSIHDTLDEWVYFLKTGQVKEEFKAKGIDKAKQKLEVAKLSPRKRAAYERDTKYLHGEASWAETQLKKEQDLKEAAKSEKAIEVAKNALELGLAISDVAKISGLTMEAVVEIQLKMGS